MPAAWDRGVEGEMFEIGPVVWLQSFATPALTGVMRGVTQLGYTPVYAALLLLLSFAVRLRPALGVLLALLLNGVMTGALKTTIAFPRPSHLDARLLEPGTASPPALGALDAGGFWSLPSAELRAAVRTTPQASYGWPSGHVSAATACCVAIVLFFRWRPFLAFAAVWPLFMGLSRMYLGRHFLADVLGGLAVGAAAAGLAFLLVRWLDRPTELASQQRRLAATWAATLALAALTPFTVLLDPETVGRLVGLVAGYGVLALVGFPDDAARLRQRAGRLAGAVLLYVAASRLLDLGLELAGWEDLPLPALLTAALVMAGTILGGVALGRRLRCYPAA